jgi:hypothetical protein
MIVFWPFLIYLVWWYVIWQLPGHFSLTIG